MFRREGPARSPRTNAALAGFLALIAGFVNSGGFILVGSFTSHVTGSLGRLADDAARTDLAAALSAAILIGGFFAGAVIASLIIESRSPRTRYGLALLAESAALLAFVFVTELARSSHPRVLDAQALLLCLAMGMQNAMVTRLSGAVVRTTHLTGVVTDLAIEAASWYRWHRAKLPVISRLFGAPPERPDGDRVLVLGTIMVGFTLGSLAGAALTLRASRWAMLAPAIATLAASGFAFYQRREA